jgi:hypothetical protein
MADDLGMREPTNPQEAIYPQFEQMRRAFKAAGGEAYFHGITLLGLVKQIQKLIDDGPPLPATHIDAEGKPDGLTRMERGEKKLILEAFMIYPGNVQAAAKWLGIGRQTLYNKLAQYRINVREKPDDAAQRLSEKGLPAGDGVGEDCGDA